MHEKVIELFEKITVEPDEVIIIILFNACAKLSTANAMTFGKDVLNRLPKSFLEHRKLVNSAIDMLMKFGDVSHAEELFQRMTKKSIVSYGAMINGRIDA